MFSKKNFITNLYKLVILVKYWCLWLFVTWGFMVGLLDKNIFQGRSSLVEHEILKALFLSQLNIISSRFKQVFREWLKTG